MKLFKRLIVSAGLVMAAGAANAQAVSPYEAGRAAAVPGYGPRLLPSQEVYTVLRHSGFSPLGIPRLRGYVYTIAVVDRRGGDGRLMIDARDGRIVRFVPGGGIGGNVDGAVATNYGPPGPPAIDLRAEPRPPRAVASRTAVPVPKPRAGEPPAAQSLAAQPAPEAPAQKSAAAPAKPAEPRTVGQSAAAATAVPAAPAPIEAKPAPQILPTQDMPSAQGLE